MSKQDRGFAGKFGSMDQRSRRWGRRGPKELAERAGALGTSEPGFEQLEQRQMLFALAPSLPGNLAPGASFTGYLQSTTGFTYAVPFVHAIFPQPAQVTPVAENFDSVPVTAPAVVPSGAQFGETSRLAITHTLPANNRPLLVERTQGDKELYIPLRPGTEVRLFQLDPTLSRAQALLQMTLTTVSVAAIPGVPALNAQDQLNGGTDINVLATGTRIRLFRGGAPVRDTAGNEVAWSTPNATFPNDRDIGTIRTVNATVPATVTYEIIDDVDQLVFDTVVLERVGNAPAVDDILLQQVDVIAPPGRFVSTIAGSGVMSTLGGVVSGFRDADLLTDFSVNETFNAATNGPVASGTIFTTGAAPTRLGVFHNLAAVPTVTGGGNKSLDFTVANNQLLLLSFMDSGATPAPRPMIRFAFSTPSGAANSVDAGTRVSLFREGRLVQEFSSAQLTALRVTAGGIDTYLLEPAPTDRTVGIANPGVGPLDQRGAAFDSVVFSREGAAGTDTISLDNVRGYHPPMVEFYDLVGRPMLNTQAVGAATGSVLLPVDENDNGVPDYNDGIGRIVFSNTDSNTNFSMLGGTSAFDDTLGTYVLTPSDSIGGTLARFETRGFGYVRRTQDATVTMLGLPNLGGSVVIGSPFLRDPTSTDTYLGVEGLQTAPGLPVILPFTTSIASPAALINVNISEGATLQGQNNLNFTSIPLLTNTVLGLPTLPPNPNPTAIYPASGLAPAVLTQGIFTTNGQSIGAVTIHGVVHGTIGVGGSLGRLDVGYLPGSINVGGDAGMISVVGDAGMYFVDPLGNVPPVDGTNLATTGRIRRTNSVITVGRALGTIQTGGRNYANVNVLGDLSNPQRARLDFTRFFENEVVYGTLPTGNIPAEQLHNLLTLISPSSNDFIGSIEGPSPTRGSLYFGGSKYRNDGILGAEFVGNPTRIVSIAGRLGGFGPVETAGEEDLSDAYAFPAQAGQSVTVAFDIFGARSVFTQLRIVDSRGRTVATHQTPAVAGNRTGSGDVSAQIRFDAPSTDVFYVVLSAPPTGNQAGFTPYLINISGMMPVTLGMYSASANAPGVSTLNGSLGLYRIGTGRSNIDGGNQAPVTGIAPTVETINDLLTQRGMTLQVSQNVAALLFGSAVDTSAGTTDINSINIGGFLGTLRTGASPLAGIGPTIGDFGGVDLRVGSSIGLIEVNSAIGARRTDFQNQLANNPTAPVRITTGTSGSPGNIGAILVGTFIVGDSFLLRTSANSTIDRFVLGTAGAAGGADSGRFLLRAPTLDLGAGSDIRFADFTGIASGFNGAPLLDNFFTGLAFGQPVTVTDDSGVLYTVSIIGGVNSRASVGRIVSLPIANGTGFVTGRVEVNLTGGAELRFTSQPGQLGLGRVVVTTDGGLRRSNVSFVGSGEIDVLRLDHTAGAALDTLINSTPGGDIVAADVRGVRAVNLTGNLGRTQVSEVSPRLIGPFLNIANDLVQVSGGALGVPANLIGLGAWGGGIYEDPSDRAFAGNNLDNLGSPFDPFLNGLVVRAGNVSSLVVSGSVGDVILQDPAGRLDGLIANADARTAFGTFDGIVGSIFAADIGSVDIGDGLIGPGDSAFAQAGIFATNDIQRVFGGTRVRNPVISGVIIAANQAQLPVRGRLDGIGSIVLTSGRFDGAFIGGSTLDSWFVSPRAAASRSLTNTDVSFALAPVNQIQAINAGFFRTSVLASSVGTIQVINAAFDASTVDAKGFRNAAVSINDGTIDSITASEFRNSTRDGERIEVRNNQILAAGAILNITTPGDMRDLIIASTTNITGVISARNMVRVDIRADRAVSSVIASNDFRSSSITTGRLTTLSAVDIRQSSVTVAGQITSVIARGAITSTNLVSTGSDGGITTISALGDISGTIQAGGPIGSIISSTGSIDGVIRTTDATDGSVSLVNARGDIRASFDVQRDVATLIAGGNIGRDPALGARDLININGSVTTISAGRQLFADLRVSQSIIGLVSIGALGRVNAVPASDQVSTGSITAFGRITGVNITGDFAGAILSFSGGIGSVTINSGSLRRSPGAFANAIEARDGDITSVTITRGHLLGGIAAPDGSIGTISVIGDGVFGNIGVDPTLSANVQTGVPAAERRNQLPPGVAATGGRDGPTISAGLDITRITVGRSIFESTIRAGRSLGGVTVTGNIDGVALPGAGQQTVIAAGDSVANVLISGSRVAGTSAARGTFIMSGVVSLGDDNLPGGVGANADVIKSGVVSGVSILNGADTVRVLAGITPGVDGVYGNGDDTVAPGLSTVTTVTIATGTGVTQNTLVQADTAVTGVTNLAGVTTGGTALPVEGGLAFSGATGGFLALPANGTAQGVQVSGVNAFIRFFGPGTAFYDQANNRVVLVNTTTASRLQVDPQVAGSNLDALRVVTTDDASLGSLTVSGVVTGNAGVYVDGTITTATFGSVTLAPTAADLTNGTRTIRAGQNIGTLTIGAANSNTLNTLLVRAGGGISSITANGGFGAGVSSRIDAWALQTLTVNGDLAGVVNLDRDLGTARVTGGLNGRIRAGTNITSVTAASATNARVSARGNITTIAITRDADGSAFLAGTDLGADGTFGTTVGVNNSADTVTNGNLTSITVGGNFTRSDVAAGINRGPDGFFATSDDLVADGRSTITSARITGTGVGSGNNSQSYGVLSNGAITAATVGGLGFDRIANFNRRLRTENVPPLQVTDLRVLNTAPRNYQARITFNQNIEVGANLANVFAALTVAEIRENGSTFPLVGGLQPGAGVDYAMRYDAPSRTLILDFAEAVTTRNLIAAGPPASFIAAPDPRTGGAGQGAGPGVYRFTILGGNNANALRGSTVSSRLDGDGNGLVGASDNFVRNALVGDAGDRFLDAVTFATTTRVDFFAPTSLNALMDNPVAPTGLPQTNRSFQISGILGDHPDTDVANFRFQNDVDLYRVSLRAGQVLRLGAIEGSARLADRVIFSASGTALQASRYTLPGVPGEDPNREVLNQLQFNGAQLQLLANPDPRSTDSLYLVRFTGDYVIGVGPALPPGSPPNQSRLAGLGQILSLAAATPGFSLATNFSLNQSQTGDFSFNVEIIDDGDSGFNGQLAPTDSAVGGAGVPSIADFAGGDNTLGTLDDVVRITRPDLAQPNADGVANPDFVFQLLPGADGIYGNGDDVITGTNGRGIIAQRIGGGAATLSRVNSAGAITQTGTVPTFASFPTAATTVNVASNVPTGPGSAAFVFSRLPGPDGVFGNADDVVYGTNGSGVNASRTAGRDGALDTGDDDIRFSSDAGDGAQLVRAPLPSEFAGVDNLLNTPDDLVTIQRGEWTFRLLPGANGVVNGNGPISDDQVVGVNLQGNRLIRTAGANGVFSNAANTDDATTFASSIGRPGQNGQASSGTLDADIIHLNNGVPLAAGTRFRATLKLSESGGNISTLPGIREQLGNLITNNFVDARGLVQFALFETTRNAAAATGAIGTNLVNSQLVAAPSNVGRANNTPGEVRNAAVGAAYGYDANGDFFMEFAVPRSQDGSNLPGTFALYLQGVVQSDYQVEVVQLPSIALPVAARTQNILIERNGSSAGIRFLEANPFSPTVLLPYDTSVNSFSGNVGGVSVDDFVLDFAGNANNVINRLQTLFDNALGVGRVRFSTNAADFEGQQFSTIFLTSSDEPPAFTTSNVNLAFGNSAGVDIFNANATDQAVVFLKSLNQLGNEPTVAGIDNFTAQLAAAVARRAGELMGVRLTVQNSPLAGTVIDVLGNDSVLFIPGTVATYNIRGNYADGSLATGLSQVDAFGRLRFLLFGNNATRSLTGLDLFSNGTQFAFGNQAAGSLLNRIFFT